MASGEDLYTFSDERRKAMQKYLKESELYTADDPFGIDRWYHRLANHTFRTEINNINQEIIEVMGKYIQQKIK